MLRRGPFQVNYGLTPLSMSEDMTKDKGYGYIYLQLAQVARGLEYIGLIILGVMEIHDNACHNGPTSQISGL